MKDEKTGVAELPTEDSSSPEASNKKEEVSKADETLEARLTSLLSLWQSLLEHLRLMVRKAPENSTQ